MNNKILFLSLFLVFPAATQCMKRLPSEIQTIDFTQTKKQKTQPITIQKLQHRRNKLLDALKNYDLKRPPHSYLTKHCSEDLLALIKGFHLRNQTSVEVCSMIGMLAWIKICPSVLSKTPMTSEQLTLAFTEQSTKYSLAGLLTMSVKNCIPCDMTYKEKKERLSQFLDSLPGASTHKDKELALVEKWERCENITKNINIFRLCLLHSKDLLTIPQDIINSITSLMFETEESLL